MSRGGIATTLNEPGAAVLCVKPTGDCFYECVEKAFASAGLDVCTLVQGQEGDEACQALRRTAAAAVDEQIFERFAMYHMAGLPDFSFMHSVENVQQLQQRMLVTGREKGCGQCLWANEFEIGAVCRALSLTVLIVDSQTKGNGRFVAVGPPAADVSASRYFLVLHRTRREHFNLVTLGGPAPETGQMRAVFLRRDLPESVAAHWSLSGAPAAASSSCSAEVVGQDGARKQWGKKEGPQVKRSVRWARGCESPPPSRERLHKRARAVSDTALALAAAPPPPLTQQFEESTRGQSQGGQLQTPDTAVAESDARARRRSPMASSGEHDRGGCSSEARRTRRRCKLPTR